jgi:hypothetical protein
MKTTRGLVLLAVLPLALLAADAPPPGKKGPPPPAIEQLAWLAGRWHLEQAGRMIDEQWMAPAAGLMLGMSRTVAKSRVTGQEFLQIRVGPGGDLFYVAAPAGQEPATFQVKKLTDREVVFENPNRDFPQRISYLLKPDGSLLAAREGPGPDGNVKRIEFPYQRVNN